MNQTPNERRQTNKHRNDEPPKTESTLNTPQRCDPMGRELMMMQPSVRKMRSRRHLGQTADDDAVLLEEPSSGKSQALLGLLRAAYGARVRTPYSTRAAVR